MVLWDPVVSGRDHLVELMASHGRMLQQAHVRPVPAPAQAGPVEILGFPLTSAMRQDLDALHLLAIEEPPANKTLVVESNPERGQGPLVEHLTSIGADLTHQHLPDSRLWIWDEAVGRILVARKIVGHVVSWIAEVCA
jgi:hypothetical protein